MASARSFTLTRKHVVLFAALAVVALLSLSSLFSYLTMRHATEVRLPFLVDILQHFSEKEEGKTRDLVRENLSAMAVRLGELQGQLMQLDSLGERLAGLAGLHAEEDSDKTNGKKTAKSDVLTGDSSGGPLLRPDNLNENDLRAALDELARQIDESSMMLSSIEDRFFEERIRRQLMPSAQPVSKVIRGSRFGWRKDPFTGQSALHEGIDFVAAKGTPIFAAAAGIVASAKMHQQYGNMIEIDHGNGLLTRYAHASKLFAKVGDFVKRGQRIAAVGSTGRSTGPHLHLEVRINGVAKNPSAFMDKKPGKNLALGR